MNCASGNSDTVVEGLLLRVEAWKRGQQGRVNIQYSLWKLLHKPRREQSHVSGKANPFYGLFFQRGHDGLVMFFAGTAFGRNQPGRQASLFRCLDPRSIRLVGDDYRNTCVGNESGGDAIRDGDEVRPAPGEKNAEVVHGFLDHFTTEARRKQSLKQR